MDDSWLSKSFHLDKIAKLNDEFFNFYRVTDRMGVTVLQVYTHAQAPILLLLELLDDVLISHLSNQHVIFHVKHFTHS